MQDNRVFKEVQDRAWSIRTWLSWQQILPDNRNRLEEKLQEVELLAWKLEKEEKEARRVAELDKEYSMADEVLEQVK